MGAVSKLARRVASPAVHRSRAFVQHAVNEASAALQARLTQADSTASARFDHLVSMIGEQQRAHGLDVEERRRLHVALRTLIEEQGTEIARLRGEVEVLAAARETPSAQL